MEADTQTPAAAAIAAKTVPTAVTTLQSIVIDDQLGTRWPGPPGCPIQGSERILGGPCILQA